MTEAEEQVAAAKKALEDAQAALAAAESAAQQAQAAAQQPATASAEPAAPVVGPLGADAVAAIEAGYAFDAPALDMGALVNGEAIPEAQVRIPIAMVNRHGLVAGATGTGKTKTLQVLAEQLSAAGVPVFAADIKGDLSGIASPGSGNDKLLARTRSIGQDWTPQASPTEYYSLGGMGQGVPIRASVKTFGPLMLSKVLGLNQTQESSLGLVFHYADSKGLELITLQDLRAVLNYLVSDEGKAELTELGGLSKATVGVILRELITFADQGADVFFGTPEIDVNDFFRVTGDRGVVSLLGVRSVLGKPELFSTFLMWLLSRLYETLPEVGDTDKPKLVFFFDEAHLLFKDASKDFQATITQVVRLIRSRGVGIFFVTQTPKDVPGDVLAQLGSRVQHQLRAHTPDDAKALKATVSTYPISDYDLGEVLTTLGIGEAIVTVMNEKGAPSPVAWTRLRAPQGSMDPTPDEQIAAAVAASPLLAKYQTTAVPAATANVVLTEQQSQAQAALAAKQQAEQQARELDAMQKQAMKDAERQARESAAEQKGREREAAAEARRQEREAERLRKQTVNAGVKIARVLVGKLFGRSR
ncbi:MAG TPA: helicase HerA-like domain-containing protein [Pseudolysinimonas sp.]|jgi:DNA helicase HerA-like ATPase|nr:helicase HerA-like domain-containing protein [Pseudolysinimonas sp.]